MSSEEDLSSALKQVMEHISTLQGRQNVNTLVLELLLHHNPDVKKALQSIPMDQFEGMLLSYSMTDQSIHAAIDQLALLRDLKG